MRIQACIDRAEDDTMVIRRVAPRNDERSGLPRRCRATLAMMAPPRTSFGASYRMYFKLSFANYCGAGISLRKLSRIMQARRM